MNSQQLMHYQNKLNYEIDSWDTFEQLEKPDSNLIVVDGRSAEAYAKEAIPGAINLPHREISAQSTAHLDKSKIYVCYCDGIGCNASTKTALKLATLGFDVRELMGGLDWWIRDGYNTQGTNGRAATGAFCGCG
ncbi:MAG: rhodanese-like domain-containing protein [Candidatus Halichondribacter symbioticus]